MPPKIPLLDFYGCVSNLMPELKIYSLHYMHYRLLALTMNFGTQPKCWRKSVERRSRASLTGSRNRWCRNDAGNYRDRFIINLSDARCPENKIAIDAAWNNARGGRCLVSRTCLCAGFCLLLTGRYATSLDAMFLVIGYRIGWHDHGGGGGGGGGDGFERTYITVRSRVDMTGPFVGGTNIIATRCRRARNTAQITYAAERDNRALNK